MSTKPGATTRSVASIVARDSAPASAAPCSMATTRPSSRAPPAAMPAAPVPSTPVPPRITRSSTVVTLGRAGGRRRGLVEAVELGHVVVQDATLVALAEVRGVLGEHVLRPGPGRVRVGEVVGPHQAVDVHEVRHLER